MKKEDAKYIIDFLEWIYQHFAPNDEDHEQFTNCFINCNNLLSDEVNGDSTSHDKALHKHIVSNNEAMKCSCGKDCKIPLCFECFEKGLERNSAVSVCPECDSKDIRPYRDHYCCYECGNYFRQTDC
jgi:hypothetical protein